MFDGTAADELLGFGNFDGDESATFRDGDGSVTQCPGNNLTRDQQGYQRNAQCQMLDYTTLSGIGICTCHIC